MFLIYIDINCNIQYSYKTQLLLMELEVFMIKYIDIFEAI